MIFSAALGGAVELFDANVKGKASGRSPAAVPAIAEQVDDSDGAPRVSGTLPAGVQTRLVTAFPLALRTVREAASCASLFARFGVEAADQLRSTTYRATSERLERHAARSGSVAFTVVGSPQTVLTRSFSLLGTREAARILIHEALHFSGLPESPLQPGAQTSREINVVVRKACGL